MYGKRADGRARFCIKIGGYSPIEIKAAAECRIDAINLGYIITYDQSKQFRFTDTLTRHFNPPPPVVRCGAPNSNRNKSTNSHHMRATFVQATPTHQMRHTDIHFMGHMWFLRTHHTTAQWPNSPFLSCLAVALPYSFPISSISTS